MIQREGDRLKVSGDLTMATVAALHDGLGPVAPGAAALVVDLSEVGVVDSAAVGLLLAWLRQAQKSSVELRFENLPQNLTSLAQMYGVAELLSV
ncbi:MAG: STAS domain-containing protein [Nitrosomonadales bacterium]|nr:STAS domain-containing protein [Nitrosomonadales bacterium]